MMKIILILLISFQWTFLNGRLLFPPGSDVGYIIPDVPDSEENGSKINVPFQSNSFQEEKVKREVKKAFWDTVFNDFGKQRRGLVQQGSVPDLSSMTENDIPNDLPDMLKDPHRGVVMGIPDKRCDDAKTNLEMDWKYSPKDFTCFTPKQRLAIQSNLEAVETCDIISPLYRPKHYCMNHAIHYTSPIPTFGPHRPLWPVFGEYHFVPPQRWLHSIEHGSVVMLYHPCAHPILVHNLKKMVKSCIYKHVISASTEVSVERPLVLIAWGCKLEMSVVDPEKVVTFIRSKALQGPEGTLTKQGTYTLGLIEKSTPPKGSDINDSNLCPIF